MQVKQVHKPWKLWKKLGGLEYVRRFYIKMLFICCYLKRVSATVLTSNINACP